jgi:hypothetical protein
MNHKKCKQQNTSRSNYQVILCTKKLLFKVVVKWIYLWIFNRIYVNYMERVYYVYYNTIQFGWLITQSVS